MKRAPMVTVALGCCGPSTEAGATMRFQPTLRQTQMTPPAPRMAPVAAAVASAYR
jgi:hypothetical protein